MVRLAGVNIPDEKKTWVSLMYVYGIGKATSLRILAETKVDGDKRAKDLTADEVNKLRNIIEKELSVEGTLRKTVMMNVKRLKDISSYRGMRHSRSLPSRGQRTKTNSRTRRGNVRKTAGSGKRKVDKK